MRGLSAFRSLPICLISRTTIPRKQNLAALLAPLVALCALAPIASAQTATLQLGPINLGMANVCPSGATVPSPCSQTATLTFQFTAPDSGISPSVLNQGVKNLDFRNAGGGTCYTNGTGHSYGVGDTCTVNVKFAPMKPGTRLGAVVLADSTGIASTGYVYGYGSGPQIAFNPTTLIAMNGFNGPGSAAIDANGSVYVADFGNHTVSKMAPGCTSFSCATLLGGGWQTPHGLAVDGAGNVYVADGGTYQVTVMPPGCSSSSCVTPLGAGFNGPLGVALDTNGNIYVADSGNNAIEKMPPGCNSIACVTSLGGGFLEPTGVAVNSAGEVYVADNDNSAVKEIPLGCTSSSCVATLGGGFSSPFEVALDAANDVYVIDTTVNTAWVIPPFCTSSSCVTALSTGFFFPQGLGVDSAGNVYVADTLHASIKELRVTTSPSLIFGATPAGETSSDSPKTVTVTNIGSSVLTFTGVSYPADFLEASGVDTDCGATTELTAGTACTLSVDFSPLLSSLSGSSMALNESVVLTDDALNGSSVTQSTAVHGTVQMPAAELTSPAAGSVLPGPKVTFNWSAPAGATAYKLWIGTSAGKNNLYSSGTIATTSATAGGLPTNGEMVYVTLVTVFGASQEYSDYKFTAATPAALTSPTPSTVLAGRTITFNWSASPGATGYKLWIGTTAGKYNLYNSGAITTTSAAASLPTNGETIYVTLITIYGTIQVSEDYTFTAATPAALTSPTPGTQLSGAEVTFNWSAAPGATAYKLWIGSSAGKNDLYSSGPITLTNATPTKLPTNGETVYVTLVTIYPASQVNAAYTFTAAP